MIYKFISLQTTDLLKSFAINQIDSQLYISISITSISVAKAFLKKHIRQNVANVITFAQMQFKFHYNRKH